MADKKLSRITWGILVAWLLLAGGLCALFFLPYSLLQKFADLFSRHGTLASFTLDRYLALAAVLPWLGILLLVAGLLAGIFRRITRVWVGRLVQFLAFQLKAGWIDCKGFFLAIRAWSPSRQSVMIVSAITLAATFLRLAVVNRPFGYDEAYTFAAFAVRPFSKIITDYSLPNNHVLHTILVRISYLLFGPSPLAVRLPALLSGVLMVPLAYYLARRLYNRSAAILGAALVAASPTLIEYSTDARGYTLMALLTLVIFILGLYLKTHKNRFGWLLLAVISALGFYDLPVMLYPYGILMLWLFVSALVGDRGWEYASAWVTIRYLVVSGLATVVLTLFFYTPILIYSGTASLVGNSFVSPLSWVDFRQTLPVRLLETWQAWTLNVPEFLTILLVAGFFMSVIFHRRLSKLRFPLQAAALLWLTIIFIFQRPNPWARIWTYLFAPLMIWSSAGVMLPLGYLKLRIAGKPSIGALAAAFSAAAILIASIGFTVQNMPSINEVHQIEGSAIFLASRIQPDDRIALDNTMDVQFWYYAYRHGISRDLFFPVPGSSYDHVYVVVSINGQGTAQTVLATRSQDGVFCNPATIQKLTIIDQTEVYECSRQ